MVQLEVPCGREHVYHECWSRWTQPVPAQQPIHYSIRTTMRTYGKNFMYKSTVSFKQRQERLATEWDVRLDISSDLTVDDIVSRIRDHLDEYLYVLCSGIERPDVQPTQGCATATQVGPWTGGANQYGSVGDHVHVCVVLLAPLKRIDVLKMLRGPRKLGDEYCAPRNPKFTYAGWFIHHAKLGFKIDGEPGIRFEHGTLPMDPLTTDSAMKIKSLQRKWGTDTTAARFKMYLDLLERDAIKRKIEQLQMSLEDH